MDYQPIKRSPEAFQQSVTPEQITAMCRRAFGTQTHVVSAVELGDGTYNSTYRVDIGVDRALILRVAPEPARHFRAEQAWMRNEHASVPYFAPIATLIPRTLAIDFTHEIIGRDYLFQTLLEGVPAPQGLAAYPRAEWASFFRGMGTIARSIHAVRGDHFGPVAGPWFASWSEALIAYFDDIAADLHDCGLGTGDVREVAQAAARCRPVLDEITEPRLLHGDLWTANLMLEPGAPEPTIIGVLDCDRTLWGDPEADWPLYRAAQRPGTERDAFWETYGPLGSAPGARLRMLFYQARHISALRLEAHRSGQAESVAASYDEMRDVLVHLKERDRA